jgi:tetratricopeptide (TPR) repeat protein
MTPERWQRASELFHAALELPQSRVDEFLRAECGDDTELYDVVHGMIQARSRSGWLDHPIVEFVEDPKLVFAEGQLVSGRYRILRFVGRGGMGEVYEAEDRDLNERVALKTLLPSIARDARMIAQFKQEIQLSRKIAHPNVCRVFDLARDPVDGFGVNLDSGPVVFLTMEFLDGETLAAKLQREGRLAVAEAGPIIQQVAQGLDAAHKAGIIHRDLKPSNVMLVPRAVITDFGLARNMPRSPQSTLTLEERLIGTLDYMAPELLTTHRATVASDIYALGMLAYKTVTGRLPFAGEPPLNGAILRSRIPVPTPRSLVADLHPAWDRAIVRALDSDPARRFATTDAFAKALRGVTASMTLPLPAMTRRKWILSGVLAGGVTTGMFLWRYAGSFGHRLPADAGMFYQKGEDNIHVGAYFAANKAFDKVVHLAPHFVLARARLAEAWNELDLTEKASQEMLLARREDLSSLSAADRLLLEAIDLTITREFEQAAAKYEQMRRYVKPGYDAGFYLDLGRAYEKAGRPLEAIESYRRSAEGPTHDPAAWLRLAVLYSRSADSAKTGEAFNQAEDLYQITSNLEGLTEVALQRGISADDRGHRDEAAEYLKKALAAARTTANPHQEIVAKLQLGTNAYLAGDVSESERYAKEALTTAQSNGMQALGARGLVGLGRSYFRKGDFSGSERYYRDALTLARQSGSRTLEAFALLPLASVHDQLRRADDAVHEARQALAFYQPNRYSKESLQCLTIIGRAERNRGDYAAALDSFRKLLQGAEQLRDKLQIALAHESIGNVLFVQEQYPAALEQFQKSLAFSVDAEHVAYASWACGWSLWLLGRYSEAVTALERAETAGSKFAALRTNLLRTRAEMALSQENYWLAAQTARSALKSDSGQNLLLAVELNTILGLALLALGQRRKALRLCEESVASAAKLDDVRSLLGSRLAVLKARVETGDKAGAARVYLDLEPTLDGHPESRWRVFALMAQIDRRKVIHARQALDELSQWGDSAFHTYLRRPDVQRLSHPLFEPVSANR